MFCCPSLIKMIEPSRSYLLSDYICGVKAVFLCFYCFLNPACLSERFMVTSCRFLQEVISYKLTYVAYKSQDRNQEIQPSFLLRAFFWHRLLLLIINFTSSSLFFSSLMQNARSFESSLSYFFPQLNATVRIQVQPAAQQAVMPLAAAAI